jgi:cellobiose phosphorylase
LPEISFQQLIDCFRNKKLIRLNFGYILYTMREFETSYGYFTEDGKEYVIKTPLTPKPWINVISNSKNYGLAISQAGSGYSWYRQAKKNRLTRWNQDLIRDDWGKYLYLRDNKSGQYWSCTYQPVKRRIKHYRCRHGLGYSAFESLHNDILSTLCVFVPPDDTLEIWQVTLKNQSSRKKDLSLFTYLEWALGVAPDAHREFSRLFIETSYDPAKKTLFATNRLWTIDRNDEESWNAPWDYIAFHSSNIRPSSFEGDKEKFLGQYGDFGSPQAVKEGSCSKTTGKWTDGIGSLQVNVKLNPKQEKRIVFLLGLAENRKQADKIISKYNSVPLAQGALRETKKMWLDLLDRFHVETPDKAFNIMNNYWLKYQAISARLWGKSAYYQVGGDYGFRDQLQDSQIFLELSANYTKEQILLNASHQYKDGAVQHWWNPLTGEGPKTNITDNLLWLPFICTRYLKETANFKLLKEKVDFIDSNRKTSILDHCLKAIDKSLARFSQRGLPLIGEGDWNDGLSSVGDKWKGESIWLGHFLYGILREWSELLVKLNKKKTSTRLKEKAEELRENINKYGWDGSWYIRATTDEGRRLGSKSQPEGKIFLNAQTWAIINNVVPQSRLKSILNSLDKYLYAEYGPLLFYPAYSKSDKKIGYLSRYAPGTRENGGLYTHAACWAIIAEVIAGRPQRAWELYNKFLPIRRGMEPQNYKAEPYVTSGNVDGPDSAHFGQGGWSWYSGSACWLYKAGVNWLLGIRPEYDGLRIEPIMPDDWNECSVVRKFRGATYKIKMIKYDGPDQIIVDGKVHKGNVIPAFGDGKEHNILFRIAKNYPVKARKIG